MSDKRRQSTTPPRPERLLATIRKLARDGLISYSYHAGYERMAERGFDVLDVKQVLLKGYVAGEITAGKKPGEWQVKLVDNLEGTSRKMGVVTVVIREQRLLIVTTEWEDR